MRTFIKTTQMLALSWQQASVLAFQHKPRRQQVQFRSLKSQIRLCQNQISYSDGAWLARLATHRY